MKRHGLKSTACIIAGMVLLTACTGKNREAASARTKQPTTPPQEETVLVYRVCEEILFCNRSGDSGEDVLTEALRFEYEYDADGNRTRQMEYDNYGNGNTCVYSYAFEGNERSVRETYNTGSNPPKYVDCQYDADGGLVERAFWSGNDYIVTRFFEADANVPVTAQLAASSRAAEDSLDQIRYISYNNGTVTEFATAQYDTDGNRVKQTIYFADGSPMYFYEYDYDAAGNVTLETVYNANGVLQNTGRFAYCYDEHGNVVEQRRYLDGHFTGKTTYCYVPIQVPKVSSDV